MGGLWSFLVGKPEKPIEKGAKGILYRIKNIFKVHYRGIVGGVIPLIFVVIGIILKKPDHAYTVTFMWIWMAVCYLLQPVNIPVTGTIPIFLLPLTCAMSTDDVVKSYMNEGIAMFIVANMLLLLWNNSGLDRRLILWFLTAGDASQCSAVKLVLKCSVCGFFLSMFSNKLIVCNIMTQYVAEVMDSYSNWTAKGGPNMSTVKYILMNVIQTSCAIGNLVIKCDPKQVLATYKGMMVPGATLPSAAHHHGPFNNIKLDWLLFYCGIPIIHSAYATLTFRALFNEIIKEDTKWPDIFNYLQYTIFAFPTALVMLILNIVYHIIVIRKPSKGMTPSLYRKIKDSLMVYRKNIPKKITLHEILTLVFSILALLVFFLRYTNVITVWDGWSAFRLDEKVPGVRDATVAVGFVIVLHALPSGYRFAKLWLAKKKSTFGPIKPESAILWWRFVDKNVTYGYIFVIGSGVALGTAIIKTDLCTYLISGSIGKIFISQGDVVYYLLICLITVFLANIMSSVPVVVILQPLVMNLAKLAVGAADGGGAGGGAAAPAPPPDLRDQAAAPAADVKEASIERIYLGALAIGIGASCGFVNPFLYTTAYFCYHTGKVPRRKMAMFGVGSAVICLVVLMLSISFYAPSIWSAKVEIKTEENKDETTTAGAAGAGADAGAPAPAPEL